MNKLKKFLVILASIVTVLALFSTIQLKTVAATSGLENGAYDSETKTITWTSTNLKIVQAQGSATNQYAPTEEQVKTPHGFKNNTLTITPLNKKILTQITITCKDTTTATNLNSEECWSTGSTKTEKNVLTWDGYVYDSSLVITFGVSTYFSSLTYVAEDVSTIFQGTDIKENLLFSYSYNENEKSIVNNPVEGRPYYLGNIVISDDVTTEHFATKATAAQIASDTMGYIETKIESVENSEYFYLLLGNTYISYKGDSTSLENTTTKPVDDKGLWYLNSKGLICNKTTQGDKQQRCLGYTNNTTYATITCQLSNTTGGAYSATPAAYLYTTKGDVSYSNVTMRIGYEISPDLKAIYDSLGYELGIVANGNYDIPCTAMFKEETNTYLYYAQITDIPVANYNTPITARGYIKNTSYRYQTTEVNQYSVKTLAKEYITNHLDNEKVQAELYTLTYLAYCA